MKYISRWMEDRIEATLQSHPVIVLTGPRQVGKSTLLENADALKGWRYLTLDDPDALDQAVEDPKGLLWDDTPTIIDEVQRCPGLLLAVKYVVDQSRGRRKFVLSGSGNVSLRQAPRETLAGRAKYVHLGGFAQGELDGAPGQGVLDRVWKEEAVAEGDGKATPDISRAVWRGGLPGAVLASTDKIALDRLSGYVDTYIQRDIQDLVCVRQPENFRRLMGALADATGWESVQEELAKHCGETRTNVSRYMSILKDTGLLLDLKGYVVRGERAYRQSKFYWFDSGTACCLAGIHSADGLAKPDVRGRYFENFILQQVLSWASLQMVAPELYYWKLKSGGAEVDFVVRSGNRAVGIEVKLSGQVGFNDTRPLRELMRAHPEVVKGLVVYTGKKVYPVATNIYVVPWTAL